MVAKKEGDAMKQDDLDEKMFYQTAEVARMLDIHPNLLRHYITPVEGHLTIFRTNGKHRRFTKETIEEIENLFSILKKKGITIDSLNTLIKAIEIRDVVNEHADGENNVDTYGNPNNTLLLDKVCMKMDDLIQIEKNHNLKIEQLLEEMLKHDNSRWFRKK